jgi:aspartyl-tRNA(Asn)/glutamyl-tRNA(Gln) amidotransferase subunit B
MISMTPYETVIGLEIHLQLATKSKMFCSCANVDTDAVPNSAVCPICLGHPGTLPVPNQEAIAMAVKFAVALGFTVPAVTKFDRKHYAYPDLPKGYQISQFDQPIGTNGSLIIDVADLPASTSAQSRQAGKPQHVNFERVHVEEDAAKNIRALDGRVLVDYNRAGTPLIEVVTKPCLTTPAEAKVFLQELQRIARYLHVSLADMELGHMRCDANISLRPAPEFLRTAPFPPNEHGFWPKTEIKNLNSFRHVERALTYEVQRQTALWVAGNPPQQESTRGWDEQRGETVQQRLKEGSADYRYFAEPDIPPIELPAAYLQRVGSDVVELPRAKRLRFQQQFNVTAEEAALLTNDEQVANWFEHVISELQEWFSARTGASEVPEEDWTKTNAKVVRQATTWVTTRLFGILAESGRPFEVHHVSAENFAELMTMLAERHVNLTTAQVVLKQMVLTGKDPHDIVEAGNLTQVTDASAIVGIVDRVLAENADIVADVKAGKVAKAQFLVGQAMKLSKGQADPTIVRKLLANKLHIEL